MNANDVPVLTLLSSERLFLKPTDETQSLWKFDGAVPDELKQQQFTSLDKGIKALIDWVRSRPKPERALLWPRLRNDAFAAASASLK